MGSDIRGKTMNILVTGGTGFIGGRLVRCLRRRFASHSLYCLVGPDRSAVELEARSRLQEIGVDIVEGDLNQPLVSARSLPPLDLVFHLAGNIDTNASEHELRVNDVGTDNLLSWLAPSLQGARVIYASSIAVLDRDRPAEGPLTETSPCVPRTAYGRTKLLGEKIIQRRAAALGYKYTILRLATVYGAGAKADGLFDRLFTLTRTHSTLGRLNWPGRTSIIHVDDVAAIMSGLAQRPEAAGETYCIANPDAPTVGALAEQIAQFAPEPVSAIRLPNWVWRAGRRLVWSPPFRVLGAAVAHTTAWRLTLILDDGFWFDTQKLQSVWTSPFKDVVEGLAEMLKY
jgi:nucleoside-diphosphate-sugar epimerase